MGWVIGAVVGGLVGWIVASLFSSGPRSGSEFLSGDYEGGGVGFVGWLFLVLLGAAIGGGAAAAWLGG